MRDILMLVWVGWLGCAVGLLVGYRLGRDAMRKQVLDTIERIQPSTRTPGQPTNLDSAPSRVTDPRWRRRMLKDGDAHNQ